MPRSYTDFPPEYAELFMRFRREKRAVVSHLTHTAALSVRRDLDRYRTALRAAIKDDAGDDYIRQLFEAARDAVIHIEPMLGDGDTLYRVAILPNPIVAAIRSKTP